ncbi:hypothetical protein [Magnetococcus sp. PR-3]|uniref:hypothetical protein n=1 Tax=Magnetococcus sp. PR-3 TaxID=3120355 RepID=UPI002FCDE940
MAPTTPPHPDVVDHTKRRQLEDRMDVWNDWLNGNDRHSLKNQLLNLFLNDAIFRALNNGRRMCKEHEDDGGPFVATDGTLGRFINQGYITMQVAAIRRLVEQPSDREERQPISIRRLIKDIKAHRELFTRECFIAYHDAPYDYEHSEAQMYLETLESRQAGEDPKFKGLETRGSDAWGTCIKLHELFDKISRTNPNKRERTDTIHDKIFTKLDKSLIFHEINEMVLYADKFVAHAADTTSREFVDADKLQVTLNKIRECQKRILRVTQAVSSELLWLGKQSPLPEPDPHPFENWGQQWLPAHAPEDLQRFWQEHIAAVREIPDLEI